MCLIFSLSTVSPVCYISYCLLKFPFTDFFFLVLIVKSQALFQIYFQILSSRRTIYKTLSVYFTNTLIFFFQPSFFYHFDAFLNPVYNLLWQCLSSIPEVHGKSRSQRYMCVFMYVHIHTCRCIHKKLLRRPRCPFRNNCNFQSQTKQYWNHRSVLIITFILPNRSFSIQIFFHSHLFLFVS